MAPFERPRAGVRVDLSLVVLVLMLAFCIAGIGELVRAYPNASRGMLIFAREQKDLFVDSGLVAESQRVRANPNFAKLLRSETVIVGTRSSADMGYVGAGVIVGKHDGMLAIVTAKHVIEHPGRRFVVFPQFAGRFADRVVPDPQHDLAVVFVRPLAGVSYRVARIAPQSFISGQRFVVMGHPGTGSWVASPGVAEKHVRSTLLFCPTCDRGDSGAGAFDDAGLLRGIVVTKAIMIAPSAKDGSDFRLTAFQIEQPQAVRAVLRRALAKNAAT
ncbi:MAG TPA: serine protease [Candidatus Baltobacteraceae bacterium]|nr:serine protease [Candidatus Baltobacteraceae bacterium]